MTDLYILPNNEAGHKLRDDLAETLQANGISVRKFEETVTYIDPDVSYVLLMLEAGKRPSEGKIARDMKRRKNEKH